MEKTYPKNDVESENEILHATGNLALVPSSVSMTATTLSFHARHPELGFQSRLFESFRPIDRLVLVARNTATITNTLGSVSEKVKAK